VKRIRYALLLGAIIISTGMGHGQESQWVRNQEIVDSYVAQHVRAMQSPDVECVEFKKARRIGIGDLNKDGITDAAVLYTLEGGQFGYSYRQYLVVFMRSKSGLLRPVTRIEVGGPSIPSEPYVKSIAVRDNIIYLTGLQHQPNDPRCCPSKNFKIRYSLVGNLLQQVGSNQ
jgi:hypothetical protein